ncbi:MAG: hypothetical protein ACYDD6_01875, partial [Acidimicrobiales bacterium]
MKKTAIALTTVLAATVPVSFSVMSSVSPASSTASKLPPIISGGRPQESFEKVPLSSDPLVAAALAKVPAPATWISQLTAEGVTLSIDGESVPVYEFSGSA